MHVKWRVTHKRCASECTLWNVLNNCPAAQKKSFSDLDNVASDGSDSFDRFITICKRLENERSDDLVKDWTEGRRNLKGNCRSLPHQWL